jgi:hypothetical protein
MATHQFKFVVSDVDLTPEQEERIARAVAQAGILALGDLTPEDSVTFQFGHHGLWNGIPPVDVVAALSAYVSERVAGEE